MLALYIQLKTGRVCLKKITLYKPRHPCTKALRPTVVAVAGDNVMYILLFSVNFVTRVEDTTWIVMPKSDDLFGEFFSEIQKKKHTKLYNVQE